MTSNTLQIIKPGTCFQIKTPDLGGLQDVAEAIFIARKKELALIVVELVTKQIYQQ